MGNGNIEVGKETPTRKAGQPLVEDSSGIRSPTEFRGKSGPAPARRQKSLLTPADLSGAMSQQGGELRGNESAPQKFVHLVGCREPKARLSIEAGRHVNTAKR